MRIKLILILFVFISLTSYSQGYNYELISMKDGLPSNHVYKVITDSKGYVWFATDRGVAKYDGHQMKVFSTKDGLPTNDVWNIKEDNFGRIWLFSFSENMYFIQDDKIVLAFEGYENCYNTNMVEFDSVVTTISHEYYFRYINGKSQRINHGIANCKVLLSHNKILELTLDNKAYIYHLTIDSTYKKAIKTPSFISSFKLYNASSRLFVHNDNLYILKNSNDRLYKWDIVTGDTISVEINQFWDSETIHCTISFENNNLYISSHLGVLVFDENLILIHQFDPQNLELSYFNDYVFTNKHNDIFISQKDVGVYVLPHQKRNCKHYEITDNNDNISFLGKTLDNKLLIGYNSGSLFEKNNNEFIRRLETYCFADCRVLDVFYRDDKVWINQSNNYNILYNSSYQPLSQEEVFSFLPKLIVNKNLNNYISSQKESDLNRFKQHVYLSGLKASYYHPSLDWFVSIGVGNASIVKMNSKNSWSVDLFYIGRQYSTIITNDSIIWYGGSQGIGYIYHDSIYDISKQHELYQKSTKKILLDQAQNLWIGTDGYGVYCYRKGKEPFVLEACIHDIVLDMVLSPDGELWVSTHEGIKQFNIPDNDPSRAKLVGIYNTLDGLSTDASTKIYVTDSTLYAGSRLGLDELSYSSYTSSVEPPKLYIQSIIVNGKNLSLDNQYDLTHNQNNIQINYSGISLKSKKSLDYHYYIENLSQDSLSTQDHSLYLEKMHSGDYKLHLWAEDFSHNKSIIKTISFHIGRPWYLRLWAILFFTGALLCLIYLILRNYQNKIQKKEMNKRRIAQLELQALQSQMNPHFIFNALAAIQQYKKENGGKTSEQYFNEFARLMRLYLESSKQTAVPLKDELDLIKNYISLEKLRFRDKFSTQINIEEGLETEYINIPSMVIQPFVENAINHGLFHKKGKGELIISINSNEEKEEIEVVIRDNGIGRKRAKEIAKASKKNYKSRAMQIIEERLAIMSLHDKTSIKIDIKDLFDNKGKPEGTMVVIHLPELG